MANNTVPNLSSSETETKENKITNANLQIVFSQETFNPVNFLNILINEAIELSASDLLFEPRKHHASIRARIEGVLYKIGGIKFNDYEKLVSRIKVLSKLDTTEKRKIQEGQFSTSYQGDIVNLRVEIVKIINGELVVIRIHKKESIVIDLSQLGFDLPSYKKYLKMFRQSGLIIVSGPTGCGKTTTLYSTITKLNKNQNYNVMTIEDPVEFNLENINQMQTQEDIGFTFATGLKSILRLSPDIILVGEIRDRETAEIAVESGLTGHLVLSTTHAEDAVGTLFRLLDLGIETYFLNSALTGIVAQRLIRKICPNCRTAYQPTPDEINLFQNVLGRPPKQLFQGKGCSQCQNLSYKGRTGVFELLTINTTVRNLLRNKVNEDEMRETLIKKGHATLLRDGLKKCEQGIATVKEILRNSLDIGL